MIDVQSYELHLLGRPKIFVNGKATALRSRKALAILALVATDQGPCTRSRLASILWESFPEKRAAANLRNALHSLRNQFPQLLNISDHEVSLTERVRLDLCEGSTEAMGRASFCEGLHLSDCPSFDTWLNGQRSRWRDRALETILKDAEMHIESGRAEAALEAAHLGVSLDPLCERAHALVIQLLRERGDLAAARRQWDLCLQSTLQELGTVPSLLACWGPALSENSSCRIYLLGQAKLIVKGVITALPYQKTVALLAYLACSGEAIERREVRALLWPSSTPDKAAANVRHAVHFLRKSLGDALCVHGEQLWLDKARFWLDVDWLKSHQGSVESVGTFCEGLTLSDCPAFEKWLEDKRRALQEVRKLTRVAEPERASTEGNLPAQLTSLVGATASLQLAASGLEESRLLTIIGPAGVGKTRMALELGRSLRDERPVWLVELGSLFDPERLVDRVCSVVGVPELPGQDLQAQLEKTLGDKKLLLIMDNCEHLISSAAHLVTSLLHRCPNLTILATSRELLRVPGEKVLAVDPLATPPDQCSQPEDLLDYASVELFVTRARAANPRFKIMPENAAHVAAVCRRLDGLPLAIELAAVRTRVLSVEQISQGLDDRFRLLRGGPRTVPQRQQTLEAALAWSYDLLSEEEKRIFRSLSVFAGGFDLEAATLVCCGDDEANDLLEILMHLIDRSLVLCHDNPQGFRYGMLETVRDFAYRELERQPELSDVRERHFQIFLDRARERKVLGVAGLAELEDDHQNFSLSLDWALQVRPESAVQLAGALGDYWFYRGHFSEGSAYLERALAQGDCPKALLWSGRLHQAQGQYEFAQREFEKSASLSTDPLDRGRALNARAQAGFSQGEYEGSLHFAESALELWMGQSFTRGVVDTLNILASAETCLGQWERAEARLQESRKLSGSNDYRWGHSGAIYLQGLIELFRGRYPAARERLTESLEVCRQLGNAPRTATCLGYLALTAIAEGKPETAGTYLKEGAEVARASGYKGVEAFLLFAQGVAALRSGRVEEAEAYLLQSLKTMRTIHVKESSELVLLCLAEIKAPSKLASILRASALDFKSKNQSIMPAYLDWVKDITDDKPVPLTEAIDLALASDRLPTHTLR